MDKKSVQLEGKNTSPEDDRETTQELPAADLAIKHRSTVEKVEKQRFLHGVRKSLKAIKRLCLVLFIGALMTPFFRGCSQGTLRAFVESADHHTSIWFGRTMPTSYRLIPNFRGSLPSNIDNILSSLDLSQWHDQSYAHGYVQGMLFFNGYWSRFQTGWHEINREIQFELDSREKERQRVAKNLNHNITYG